MALRDIDVDIELDVDYGELTYLNEEIDETLRLLKGIDDDNIIDLTREFRRMGRQVDNATQDVRQLNRQVETLSDINVDVDMEDPLADIKRLQMQIEALDREDINVDIDIRNAASELTKLYTQMKMIDGKDIDINVDVNGALKELGILRAQLNAFKATNSISLPSMGMDLLSNFNLVGLAKAAGIIVALPVLLPIVATLIGAVGTLGVAIGVLAGGLLGIASAAVIAGGGLLAFSSLAISSISDLYEEDAKLTTEQKQLKQETDKLVGSWGDLKESLSDEVFDVASRGVKSLNKLLDMSTPILEHAGDSVAKLLGSFDKSLKTNEVKSFFKYVDSSIGPLTESLGGGLGYALKGVANTIVALGPLTSWMADGFEGMMSKFSDWTAGLKGSEGMKTFIDYIKDNLPKLGSILGDGSVGVAKFFAAFDTTAADGLDWLVDKMKDFSKWASGLDENKDFQKFLDYIKGNGPEIANIIGNVSESISNLVGSLSKDGGNKLGFLSDLSDFVLKLEDNGFTDLVKSLMTFDLKGVYGSIGEMTKNLLGDIDITGAISNIDWSSYISSINWASFIPGLSWLGFVKNIDWSSFVKHLSWVDFIKSLTWSTFVKGLSWSSFVKILSWASFIKNLGWGSFIKHLNWSGFIKSLTWGGFVKGLTWASFIPKLSWGSFVGGIKSLIGGSRDGSHANGLGRVPFDGYTAELHKNEAVLTAQQSDTLRSAGMLQGDGAYPTLDMNAVSNYEPLAATSSNTTTTSTTSSKTVVIEAPVTIRVEGGKDGESTAKNVKDQLEEYFEDLQDIFTVVLEG
ncbi:hypothetical protein M2M59_04030 [Rummeliibacillus sp. G93]|uniref:hypothetical protein n=1 Tax=Rummeliibacillus sp. G93 TaxID=2939494 RepID=UPI00201BA2AC|nr:hypothetical protein [Rummeliibacillus sp. G93]UQW98186.1 hypothetical protein M2M59_04030 [Rummeliibacillus sp. G93]